jgi:hypothetical protein
MRAEGGRRKGNCGRRERTSSEDEAEAEAEYERGEGKRAYVRRERRRHMRLAGRSSQH